MRKTEKSRPNAKHATALCAVCIIPHHTFFDIKNRIPGWIRAEWWRIYVDYIDTIIHGPVFDVLRRFDSQMGICP